MPLGKILCDTILFTVLYETIVLLGKVVCDTVLSFDVISKDMVDSFV